MANRYNSTLRSFMARNIIQQANANPALFDLFAMNAPTAITIATVGGNSPYVKQPFRANWGNIVGWNLNSNCNIKRVGIYSNFADGLVFEGKNSRLALRISASVLQIVDYNVPGGTVTVTANSPYITSVGVDLSVLCASHYFLDGTLNLGVSTLYHTYNEAAGAARLSDYSDRTYTASDDFPLVTVVKNVNFPVIQLPAFNTMFDLEQYVNLNTYALTLVPTGVKNTVILSAEVLLLPGDGDGMVLSTNTIDTSFNTQYVSFDAMIDVETTSA